MPVPSFVSEDSICDIDITESTVLQKLLELKVNKAPSPDGIHSYILKACANTLYVPLTILYSQFLSSGVLPMSRNRHTFFLFLKRVKETKLPTTGQLV